MYISRDILEVFELLFEHGFDGYLVGGCVRDFYLGRTVHDFDIATSATPLEIKACFPNAKTIPTGERHGTVILNTGSHVLEITTFRVEDEYVDFRHPNSVKFTTNIAEDLSRRDFTINAMAYNTKCGLIDNFGGMQDLEKGIIRCVGTAKDRFHEDALRILRALRFVARFGFKLENETLIAAHSCAYLLKNISAERISVELQGILLGDYASDVLREFSDIISEVFPLDNNRLSELSAAISNTPKDIKTRLCIFVLAANSPLETAINSLKLARDLSDTLMCVCANVDCASVQDDFKAKLLLSHFGNSRVKLMLAVQKAYGADTATAENLLDKVLNSGDCYNLSMLKINGGHIIRLGVAQGEKIGEILQCLLIRVMQGKLVNEEESLVEATKIMLNN